jgi:hypothetical protein
MFKNYLFSLLFIVSVTVVSAQKTDYFSANLNEKLSPSLPQYKDYKTFDLQVITTKEEQDKPGEGFNIAYKPIIGKLEQVEKGGDFHIVTLLQKYSGKLTSPSSATVNVFIKCTVFNKYGLFVLEDFINNEALVVTLEKELTEAERKNSDIVRGSIMSKLIKATCYTLRDGMYGGSLNKEIKIASLDKVKKIPELQAFEEQVKSLVKVLGSKGLAGFKDAAEPFLPYWEKTIAYAGEDVEEVKRTCYHNLALYYIAAGKFDKAKEYIELYKPIDKTIKEMMGLIKYKNSEKLEELLIALQPVNEVSPSNEVSGKIATKEEVLENYKYIVVNGSVTVTAKKEAGTYVGKIKINKIPASSFGNIVSLDAENITAIIETKDAQGQPKIINTTVSKLENLKDNDGTKYISQKYGTGLLGTGYFSFLKSTYSSPKVTVYRSLIPASNGDYVVKKNGDETGVKNTLINARKNLIEYFNECTSLTEKVKSGEIDRKATVEKIAEIYSDCK